MGSPNRPVGQLFLADWFESLIRGNGLLTARDGECSGTVAADGFEQFKIVAERDLQ